MTFKDSSLREREISQKRTTAGPSKIKPRAPIELSGLGLRTAHNRDENMNFLLALKLLSLKLSRFS